MKIVKIFLRQNNFKKIIIFFFLFLFVMCSKKDGLHKFSGQTMGTVYNITIYKPSLSEDELSFVKEKVELTLIKVNKKMNPFDPQSEISKFNDHHFLTPFPISDEFYDLIITAKEIYQISNGAFDPTIAPLVNYYGFGTTGNEPKTISKKNFVFNPALFGSILKNKFPDRIEAKSDLFDKFNINELLRY